MARVQSDGTKSGKNFFNEGSAGRRFEDRVSAKIYNDAQGPVGGASTGGGMASRSPMQTVLTGSDNGQRRAASGTADVEKKTLLGS